MSYGTILNRPVRGKAPAAREGEGRSADGWLANVVFGTPEPKIPVNIRLDADIVQYFRAGGPGYQTRINEVLRAFVAARLRAGENPGAPLKPRGATRKKAK